MFDILFIASIIGSTVQAYKESKAPVVPAENWANMELYNKDIVNGVSIEQRMKNLENGKYRLTEKHPEPHRNPVNGKIIIDNYELYCSDTAKYGGAQVQKWLNQGKYNLSSNELKKEKDRIKKEYEYLYSLL